MKERLPLLAFLLALAFAALVLQWEGHRLPERVASHFDAQGQADGWTSRAEEVRHFYAFALGVPLGLVALVYLIRFLPPRLLNFPNPEYWRKPENFPRACALLLQAALWLGAFLVLHGVGLRHLTVEANLHQPPALDHAKVFLLLAVELGAILGCIAWIHRRFSEMPEKAEALN